MNEQIKQFFMENPDFFKAMNDEQVIDMYNLIQYVNGAENEEFIYSVEKDFDSMMQSLTPVEIAGICAYGDFNPNHTYYVCFDDTIKSFDKIPRDVFHKMVDVIFNAIFSDEDCMRLIVYKYLEKIGLVVEVNLPE